LFVDLLDQAGRDASEIYLLGDFSTFGMNIVKYVPRGFVRTLGKIAELTDRGIKVHFFTGNHDVWGRRLFAVRNRVIVHREPLLPQLPVKCFIMGHGDGLDPSDGDICC
jgi:UDP-2,3-diacylglucosamine hydrolase